MAGFEDFEIKDSRERPFLGPIQKKIPGWEAGMEPVYSPTRAGARKTVLPAVRQLTGFGIGMEKNSVERELDRLQFDAQEINPSTGIPKLDNLIAKELGPIVEEDLVPMVESRFYKMLSNEEKAVVLLEEIREARKDARELALIDNPELREELEVKRIPRREKILMRKTGELP